MLRLLSRSCLRPRVPFFRQAFSTKTNEVIESDYVVIGGGIAGASCAYYLSNPALLDSSSRAAPKVVLLEREDQPGFHSTGRSAALYSETYGNSTIRALTTGSREGFENPPANFFDSVSSRVPLLKPRATLWIGNESQKQSLRNMFDDGSKLVNSLKKLSKKEVLELCPVVRPEYALDGECWLEPEATDIDVHALHHGFLRGFKTHGGRVVTRAEVTALSTNGGGWEVVTERGVTVRARQGVINAGGAWADQIGQMAGCKPIGLVPKRRTIIVFDVPQNRFTTQQVNQWPFVMDPDEQWYFKPDAGTIWASPADETPTDPCDAQPDELDMAICMDRIMTVTDMQITRLVNKWAGLRSFVKDKSPVVGADPKHKNFVWLAGQGGYGIQTSFGMGVLSASLSLGLPVPKSLTRLGFQLSEVAPDRPGL